MNKSSEQLQLDYSESSGLMGSTSKSVFGYEDRMSHVFLATQLAIPLALVFGSLNYFAYGFRILGLVEIGLCILLLIPAYIIRHRYIGFAETLIILFAYTISMALIWQGGILGSGALWIFCFPFLSTWLKGQRNGFFWNTAWLAGLILLLTFSSEIRYAYQYSSDYSGQLLWATVFYAGIATAINATREKLEIKLHRSANGHSQQAQHYLAQLEATLYQDSVTGLPSRARLIEILQDEMRLAKQNGYRLLCVNIRLKRMFEIANLLGEEGSDKLINAISQTMFNAIGSQGIFSRVRRDEFVCVYRAPKDGDPCNEVVQRLLASKLEYQIGGYTVHMEHTMGIAEYPDHAKTSQELLQRAEQARLQAQFSYLPMAKYDASQEQQFMRRHYLFGRLNAALNQGNLSLYFQPQVNLTTGVVTGVEALARWHDPECGYVAPIEFIPIAEQSGLIKPLTEWVLRTALVEQAKWVAEGWNIPVSVNISARNISDEQFVDQVDALLKQHQIAPELLMLELTESSFLSSPETALQAVNKLHELGVKISIDDFGTGYSSLTLLKKLPVDELKIDQSFVRDLLDDPGCYAIINSILQLAQNLNLWVVAEGIEDVEIASKLKKMGCDSGQGYWCSKPLPHEQFQTWIRLQNAKKGSLEYN